MARTASFIHLMGDCDPRWKLKANVGDDGEEYIVLDFDGGDIFMPPKYLDLLAEEIGKYYEAKYPRPTERTDNAPVQP